MNSKGRRSIDRLIDSTKKKIDKKGLFENAGYDQYHKVLDIIAKLDLTYQEECELKDYFRSQCDTLVDYANRK